MPNSENSEFPGLMFLLNTFSGEELECEFFFDQLESLAESGQWSDAEKITVLKSRLRGEAQKFFITTPELKHATDFKKVKQIFIEYFVKSDNVVTRHGKLIQAKQEQGETVKQLARKITAITQEFVQHAETPENNKMIDHIRLSTFIEALKPKLKQETLLRSPETFKEAVAIASNVESVFESTEERQINYTTHTPNTDLTTQTQLQEAKILLQEQQLKFLTEELNTLKISKHSSNVQSPKQIQLSHKNNEIQPMIPCMFCGRRNHFSANCRKQNQSHQTTDSYFPSSAPREIYYANERRPPRLPQRGRNFRSSYFPNPGQNLHTNDRRRSPQCEISYLRDAAPYYEENFYENRSERNLPQDSYSYRDARIAQIFQEQDNDLQRNENSPTKTHYVYATDEPGSAFSLPTVILEFNKFAIPALVDSGSSICVLSDEAFQCIRQNTRVKFMSRSVTIRTLTGHQIQYSSAVEISFQIAYQQLQNVTMGNGNDSSRRNCFAREVFFIT